MNHISLTLNTHIPLSIALSAALQAYNPSLVTTSRNPTSINPNATNLFPNMCLCVTVLVHPSLIETDICLHWSGSKPYSANTHGVQDPNTSHNPRDERK